MKARTRARSLALQVLYEIDVTDHPPEEVLIAQMSENPLDDRLSTFAREIIFGVIPFTSKLDQFIAEHAPEWPIDQVAIIDRNIIRIALWEFIVSQDTPVKVAINEAIELAKIFGSDSSPRFVNGVLGSLASRKNEIRQIIRTTKNER